MAEKKRYTYLDVLRLIAFFSIILYHYMIELENHGQYDFTGGIVRYANANVHIATMGVALFFMISGAGLYLSARGRFVWREYMRRRFVKLMIPFYIVYLGVLAAARIIGYQVHSGEVIPRWRFILTILGVDQYTEELFPGFSTFSLGVGEWFVGCLILLYLIFPVIRLCMQHSWKRTMLAATVLYMLIVLRYPFRIAVHLNVLVKLYEFMLGMCLAMHYDFLTKHKRAVCVISAAVTVLFVCCPARLPVAEGLRITIFAMAVFCLILEMEDRLSQHKWMDKVVRFIGGYTYEMFLIQHYVILAVVLLTAEVKKTPLTVTGILVLCAAGIFVLGYLIRVIENAVQYGWKCLKGKRQKPDKN